MAKTLADDFMDLIGGNDEHSTVKMFLDTGFPPLNKAISGRFDGGLPVGRIVEMFGPESCGKTAIATSAMAAAQRAGGLAGFSDHERSFSGDLAANLGLDLNPSRFIFKTPETFELSINTAIKVAQFVREKEKIEPDAPLVWVFDSLAAMVPKSKSEKNVEEYGMHDNTALARATSAVFPALASFAEKYNMLMLFLNQTRTKPGIAYGDPTTTPGGESPKFYSSVRIKLGRKKIMAGEGADKEFVGQEIQATCIKNKVARPFQDARWEFRFRPDGTGFFDVTSSLLNYLTEIESLDKSDGRIKWVDGKTYYHKKLVEKIEAEKLHADLMGLLPKE